MKICVLSDSHGDYAMLNHLFQQLKDIDKIFFLGDGIREMKDISVKFHIPAVMVKGNNDLGMLKPFDRVEEIKGYRILLTHGHNYMVYSAKHLLLQRATELACSIVLFGHTHIPYHEELEGITLFNPGSVRYPRGGSRKGYAILTVQKNEICFEQMYINE
jgi:hypothetical protein